MQVLRIKVSDLQIPEYRQRKIFNEDSLVELMDSISTHGLLQPLVVREVSFVEGRNGSGTAGRDTIYYLVAGERRLRAIKTLGGMGGPYRFAGVEWPADHVPCIPLGDLDALAAESAELEENIRRVDLSWQERARATSRLADLRSRQASHAGAQQPTLGDLASELRPDDEKAGAQTATRREIILAAHLDKPEVAQATSLKDAWKALKRHDEAKRNVELARIVGATFTSAAHTLVRSDCFDWMAKQPDAQFDVILTDPPYGIDADSFGDAGGRLVHQTHKYEDAPQIDMLSFFAQAFRLAKAEAHMYVCCDIDFFVEWKEQARSCGWYVHRTPIINYKRDGSRVPLPQHGPQRKYELILYAIKGNKPVTRIYPDVIETHGDANLSHGAQKPVALFLDLLRRSVRAGDSVLDPFAGTGTALVAAHELKCRCTAIEMSEQYYGVALKRLQELK